MNQNRKAFLDMIAYSEIGPALLAKSDNGYNVVVGGALFNNGYRDHPRQMVTLKRLGIKSSAAGRYQILMRIYDHYKQVLKLRDFSPEAQDAIALHLIWERHALDEVDAGKFEQAVTAVRNIWASLPGAGYGQHENKMESLRAAYTKAGGSICA